MKTAITAILIMAGNGAAFAQTPPEFIPAAPICWLAGLEFSPGATARASNTVMVCGTDGTWANSKDDAAGCIKEGKLSNTQSLEGVSNNKAVSVECQADGTWKNVPIGTPK